ncbi:MAG TPA: c-type cytochrome [Gemmatimonadaceae bacterium]|nr:c-type cytochrome [Gemmatimonadaceae bacterium]
MRFFVPQSPLHDARRLLRRSTVILAVSAAATGCKEVRVAAADSAMASGDSLVSPEPVRRVRFRIPSESEITDPVILASVRRGRALLRHTRDSLPRHVGNQLQCVSCHPADGTRPNVMPWVGIYVRFPQYRARAGATQLIEDRINDCFKRSMNGRPLVPESRDMRDIIAYFAFLSSGYPQFAQVEGQSIPPVPPLQGDTVRAAALYPAKCAACHGLDGLGTTLAPPLWGPQSFNIGAGMARLRTAAAFIKQAMPQNAPGTLTDQEAYDLARLVTSRPRPDFEGKELDWPNGDPPPDVAYPTLAAERKARAAAAAGTATRDSSARR